MSKIKKLIALTLALAMVLSASVFAGNYTATTYADAANFDEACEEAIEVMYALNIMKGVDDKNFAPTEGITRASIAKMIYVILNKGVDDGAVNYLGAKFFTDVEAGAWYEGYVNFCRTIQLVAGRGDGTFGPNDKVTTAEAAKMLLTAIGYNAEDRGYVGANWDSAVLRDAAIIGLLNNYGYNTTGIAPRQWIAVMFYNALVEAYTYQNMVAIPSVNGLLTAETIWNLDEYDLLTFGEKYLGFDLVEGVMTATDAATLTGKFAAEGTVTIAGKDIKGTGLGYMDLGETYRVVVKGSKALSTRNTGDAEVGISTIKDITAEVAYSVSGNLANNSYVFTVDGVEAPFADFIAENNKVTRDAVAAVSTSDVDGYICYAKNLYAAMGAKTNDLVKAVAYDGEITYLVCVDYAYGVVTYTANSTKYGEYVQVKDVEGNYLKAANSINLYLSDAIETDDDLAVNNIVKFFINPDSGLYNMEVLPVVEPSVYGGKTTKGVYYFDGEGYYLGVEGWMDAADMTEWSKDDEVVLCVDGELVIMVSNIDKTLKTLDAVNEQLAIIYDYYFVDDIHFSDGTSESIYNVYYMTIDGEKHVAQYSLDYDIDDEAYVPGTTLARWIDQDWRLFILHAEEDETVWAEELDELTVNEQLNVAKSVIDAYTEDKAVVVNTKYNTIYDAEDARIAEIDPEVKLFVRLGDSSYAVKTLAELRDSYTDTTLVQILTLENSRKVPVVQAGYLDLRTLKADEYAGFMYLTAEEDGYVNKGSDKYAVAEATLSNGDVVTDIVVKLEGVEPSEEALYSYTYNAKDAVYELTLVVANKSALKDRFYITEKWNEDDAFEEYKVADGKYTIRNVGDQVVVLSTFTIELDEAVADKREALEMIEEEQLEAVFGETKFVDFDELPDEIIEGKEDEGPTYYYATEYRFDSKVLYVKLFNIMIDAGELDVMGNAQ